MSRRARRGWPAWKDRRPRPHPEVESRTEDGATVLCAPVARRRGWLGRLARSMGRDDLQRYELEPVGLFVWERLDGRRTCGALCGELRKRFGMNRLEAEVALAAFLELLWERGLIEPGAGR